MESDDDYGLYEATDSGNVSPEEDDSDEMVSFFFKCANFVQFVLLIF